MGNDAKKLESIRKSLLERKHELEQVLIEMNQESGAADPVKDIGDQVQSSTSETLRISLQDAELQEYNRIVQALEKIKTGTYGICVDCGQPISEKRLVSYPNASRCIACQELFEETTAAI